MYSNYSGDQSYSGNGMGCLRSIIPIAIVLFSIVSYLGKSNVNPVTGKVQRVDLSPSQEITLGLQTAPAMIRQYGGEVSEGPSYDRVQRIGRILADSGPAQKSPYKFQFHLLNDNRTINAFALPGGQVFLTNALYSKLSTDGQLLGVLGHEVGHVLSRHGAQQLAKSKLISGLAGAGAMATYDGRPSSYAKGAAIQAAAKLLSLKYGRTDEIEADEWGLTLASESGYNPNAMLQVMQILQDSMKGGRQPEMLSTHPLPENRARLLKEKILRLYPNGVPAGFQP